MTELMVVTTYNSGAEAMFADMGHFNKSSIQVKWSCKLQPTCYGLMFLC